MLFSLVSVEGALRASAKLRCYRRSDATLPFSCVSLRLSRLNLGVPEPPVPHIKPNMLFYGTY